MQEEFNADSIYFHDKKRVTEAHVSESRRLVATISDQVYEWPELWLGWSCECDKCFSRPSLNFRNSLRYVLKSDASIKTVEIVEEGKAVRCVWSDDHVSVFTADWLYNRRITEDGAAERNFVMKMYKAQAWPDPKDVVIQRGTWKEFTESSEAFEEFGKALSRDGVYIITDSPDRFLFREMEDKTGMTLFACNYGQNFTVENIPDPINVAYTTARLELHVDQSYLRTCPEIQFLHCIKPAEIGGENILTDGNKAASVLKERHPKHYQTLCTVKTVHEDLIAIPGQMHHYVTNTGPILNLNEDGQVEYIRLANHSHSSFYNGSIQELEDWLQAMKEFWEILYEVSIKVKTKAGDILVFNNKRILHARESYDLSCSRVVEGFYTSWDYVHSRLRVAQIKNHMKQL